MTTRGLGEEEFRRIVILVDRVLGEIGNADTEKRVRNEIGELCRAFPLYDVAAV